MGRDKIIGVCKEADCTAARVKKDRCQKHYDQWRYKYGHLRCMWEKCKNHQEDGGRRMGAGRNKKFYCRLHEVEHLRSTPEIEAINLKRLAEKITPYGECWIASGKAMGRNDKYVGFAPEGADQADWLFHRVLWDLLMGGHKPKYELDHIRIDRTRRNDCDPSCCNPAHLEPVLRGENERRKKSGAGQVNWTAAQTPAVIDFAQKYGLPLPIKGARPGVQPKKLSNPSA